MEGSEFKHSQMKQSYNLSLDNLGDGFCWPCRNTIPFTFSELTFGRFTLTWVNAQLTLEAAHCLPLTRADAKDWSQGGHGLFYIQTRNFLGYAKVILGI